MSTDLTATYKNVQVVREFVRQLYGFDKGTLSTFINKTRVHRTLLEGFLTTISCWRGF